MFSGVHMRRQEPEACHIRLTVRPVMAGCCLTRTFTPGATSQHQSRKLISQFPTHAQARCCHTSSDTHYCTFWRPHARGSHEHGESAAKHLSVALLAPVDVSARELLLAEKKTLTQHVLRGPFKHELPECPTQRTNVRLASTISRAVCSAC